MARVLIAVAVGFVVGWLIFYEGTANGWFSDNTVLLLTGLALVVVAVFVVQSLSKNRKVVRASASEARAAREAAPLAGGGAIFIFRDQFVGRAVGSGVVVDGTEIGQLRGSTFYRIDLPPGEHRLASTMNNSKDATLNVTLAAGERAFIRVSLTMGMMGARQQLETVPAPAADRALARCRMLLPQTRLPA